MPARTWIVAGVLAVSVAPAAANVGAPWSGGERAGEPVGITEIAITHEELVIDTRPLAVGGLVGVAATYHIDNQAAAKHLDLVFATGSKTISQFHVRLDGHELATGRSDATLPASWRSPDTIPTPEGGTESYELDRDATAVGFSLDVAPGRHELAISYAADAVTYSNHGPLVLREFAYVLSPARTWAGFGGLDVTVHVPPGWRAAITPALARSGDAFHAVFATVPSDAIALSVQAPLGAYSTIRALGRALLAVVALGGAFAVAWHTRRRGRAGKLPSGLVTMARGVVWGAAIVASGGFAIYGADLALPDGQLAHRYGYGQALEMIAIVLAAIVAIGIAAIISRVVARYFQ